MKNFFKLFGSLLFIFLFVGCDEDFSVSTDFANVDPPSYVSALFDVTQDNTGKDWWVQMIGMSEAAFKF